MPYVDVIERVRRPCPVGFSVVDLELHIGWNPGGLDWTQIGPDNLCRRIAPVKRAGEYPITERWILVWLTLQYRLPRCPSLSRHPRSSGDCPQLALNEACYRLTSCQCGAWYPICFFVFFPSVNTPYADLTITCPMNNWPVLFFLEFLRHVNSETLPPLIATYWKLPRHWGMGISCDFSVSHRSPKK